MVEEMKKTDIAKELITKHVDFIMFCINSEGAIHGEDRVAELNNFFMDECNRLNKEYSEKSEIELMFMGLEKARGSLERMLQKVGTEND